MMRIEKDGEDGDGRFSLVLVTNKSIRRNFIILTVSLSLSLSLSSNHCMHASVPIAGFLSSPDHMCVGDKQQHENTVLILAQSIPSHLLELSQSTCIVSSSFLSDRSVDQILGHSRSVF
jgi:hypothetical protein